MTDDRSELAALRIELSRIELEFEARLRAMRDAIERIESTRRPTETSDPPASGGPARVDVDRSGSVPGAASSPSLAEPTPPSPAHTDLTIDFGDLPAVEGPPRVSAFNKVVVGLVAASGPIGGLAERMLAAYHHYRDQGKAPAFLMTLAGLVALTAGFGYLLQYSFSNLAPMAKLGLGALTAVAIVTGGARLHRSDRQMRDFASSIIGLGVIVLYLCAYFAGSYYGLVSSPTMFALFVAVVVVSYLLAIAFETRVVAVVTLVGGVMAPWLVSDPRSLSDPHAIFIVLLTGASLHLARRLDWNPLTQLAFVATVPVLEAIALDGHATPWVLGATAIAHSYLFFYFLMLVHRTDTPATRVTLVLLTGEVAFVVLVCVQAFDSATLLGGVLIANAAVVSTPFFLRLAHGARRRAVFLLAGGVYLGYGLLALTSIDYLGLLWGIEAIALVYIGSRYETPSVRYEGLGLLGLSAISTLWAAGEWFLGWRWDVSSAWLAMVALIVYLELAARIIGRDRAAVRQGRHLGPWLHELEGVVGALVWLGLVCIVEPDWIAVLAVVPLFGLLYFASVRKLALGQAIGLAHAGVFVAAIAIAGLETGSFRFGLQPTLAQVARIELFAVLWLLQAFYERFHPEGALARWSRPLRQLFYVLVPLLLLPKVARDFTAFLPIALWVSATVAWVLYRLVGSLPLRIETILLAIGSAGFTLAASASDYLDLTGMHSYWSLAVGLGFFGVFGYAEGALGTVFGHPLRLVLLTTGFYLGGVLLAVVFAVAESLSLAAAVTAGYFAAIGSGHVRLSLARPVIGSAYLLAVLLAGAAVLAGFEETDSGLALLLYEALGLSAWGYLLHRNVAAARLGRRRLRGAIVQQWLWHGLIVLGYLSVFGATFGDYLGPATSVCLVLHATAVLFLTLRSRWRALVRLAASLFVAAALKVVLYDMADFSAVEKIVALIVIGSILLGAAYGFQRIRGAIGRETSIA